MKSLISLIGAPELMPVKETYPTVKKRLLSEGSFFEVTNSEGKVTLSKSVIAMIGPISKNAKEIKVRKAQKNR